MKVLHINCDYIGMPLHQLLINALEERNIDNWVFAPTSVEEQQIIVPREKDVIKRCFRIRDRFFFRLKQDKIFKAFSDVIKKHEIPFEHKPDIIHSYFLFTDGSCARRIAREYSIPYVVTVRNTDVNYFFKYRILLRRVGINNMLDAERIFFLSEPYKNKVLSRYVPRKFRKNIQEKSVVISNGIDSYWLTNRYNSRDYNKIFDRFQKKEIRLVYAGRIDKNKNIELIIKAMARLRVNGWIVSLNAIGPIFDKNVYKEIMKEEMVHYFPQMPKEQLIEKYREADVFVMPSHYETFGLVYAEAMSQGLPVIYTRGQGFDGHFKDGTVGFSVDDYDEKMLENTIIKITENYKTLSENAVKLVVKFDWQLVAKRYSEVYEQVKGKSI